MIEMQGISKIYGQGDAAVHALRDVDLTVDRGEFVAIVGPSGCGKSTLMNLIGCLDQPTSGSYLLDGQPVDQLDDDQISAIRNQQIGFVFQQFNLLARTPAVENVELPLLYSHDSPAGRRRAIELLEQVGLGERVRHLPSELSGGQQQRVAIARALITDPAILLADEPTGALDSRAGLEIMAIFQRLHADGRTIVLVTHDLDLAEHTRRIVALQDGAIVDDRPVETPRDAEQVLATATADGDAK
jgi:putative ABC transport system ATP-binding protein